MTAFEAWPCVKWSTQACVVCFHQHGPAASIPLSQPSFIISRSIQDASLCSSDVERNTASKHVGVQVHMCILCLLSDLCPPHPPFLQICNEKIAEEGEGGWGESSQRPLMPKVMEAIILPDVGDAGLSQSWRTDNKYAKWFSAPSLPPTSYCNPPSSLHHLPTNNQFYTRDYAVDLAGLRCSLALPKGMNVTRCV